MAFSNPVPQRTYKDPDIPKKLWIYTNYDCNMRCSYCVAESSPRAPRRLLSLDTVERLVDEAHALQFEHVYFTGGEPFLLSEIFAMLAYSSRRLKTTVLTNAMLFQGKRLDSLTAILSDNLLVQVSLDGSRPEQHDPYPTSSSASNNYSILQQFENTTDKWNGKVDYQLGPALSFFGRYGYRKADLFDSPPLPLPSGGAGNAFTYVTNKQFAAGFTRARTGTSLLEGRLGWSRTVAGKNPAALGTASALEAYGIRGLPTDERISGGLPTQLITGYSDLGRQATNPQWQYPTLWNPKINYTWIMSRHSLKTGYEFQHIGTEVQDVNPLYGRDSYTGNFTRPAGATASNLYNLADFMLGLRSQYALSNILIANLRQQMHFAYVQDDFRMGSSAFHPDPP